MRRTDAAGAIVLALVLAASAMALAEVRGGPLPEGVICRTGLVAVPSR